MMQSRATLQIALATCAAVVAAGVLLPLLLGFYYLQVADVTLVNIVLALGLNFILGFGGQMSLAQCAFFGIGAYSFALMQVAGVPTPVAAIGAVLCTAGVGVLLGWPTLRLRGHYLALATLAFAVIVEKLLVNLEITGGASGVMAIPGIGLSGDNESMLYVLLAVAGLAFLGSAAFARSPLGLRVRAFRDDAMAAQAIGVDTRWLKVGLFVVSAVYAAVAGIGYVSLRGYLSPDIFAWQTTFGYLAMVVVGGLGSSLGAVLGAILYTFVPEWLRFLQEYYFVIFGSVVVLVITFFPAGLAGLVARAAAALQRLRPPASVPVGLSTERAR